VAGVLMGNKLGFGEFMILSGSKPVLMSYAAGDIVCKRMREPAKWLI
jgi:hypothetical protein